MDESPDGCLSKAHRLRQQGVFDASAYVYDQENADLTGRIVSVTIRKRW